MPEFYVNRISLSNGHEAVSYTIKESKDAYGGIIVIKIINETKEVVQEIKPNRYHNLEVHSMCFIPQKELIAISYVRGKIQIYHPMENKLVEELNPLGFGHNLLIVNDSLLISGSGYLNFYDIDTFNKKKDILIGDSLNAIAASNNFIVCDVWDRKKQISQAKIYDSDGNYIRNLGERRVKPANRSCFLGFIDDKNVFVAFPDIHKCDIFVYQLSNGNKINTITFKNDSQLYICSLPKGGIAISHDTTPKQIKIIDNPLRDVESALLATSNFFINSFEDMISFVSQHERNKLPFTIGGISSALAKLSIFPRPIENIITQYCIENQALKDDEVNKFFRY